MEPGKWAGWLITGSEEMVKLVDEQLNETADWETNLKALKVGVYNFMYMAVMQKQTSFVSSEALQSGFMTVIRLMQQHGSDPT